MASFTDMVSGLTVNVDASASYDPDGSIVSYAWDWGDGTTGTGETASHTYASPGTFTITLTVTDNAALTGNASKSVSIVRNYFWTWYDDVGGDNWVLLANPAAASASLGFSLSIAGTPEPLPGGGVVAPGQVITSTYPGVIGGPVEASSLTGAGGAVSQRTLWPKGGSSLEELPGTEGSRLSNRFWWTWYDNESSGYTNWVLISNPGVDHNGNAQGTVTATIRIAGATVFTGGIAPGTDITPAFPGTIGGPVEVDITGGDVMASQRVLSNSGGAFNEVPGIPQTSLSSRYLWTWYDMQSSGAANWVLISNPGIDHNGNSQGTVTATIKIAGATIFTGSIAPGTDVTPTFPGTIGGPVEVDSSGGDVIATQRSIFGPSFEEVPGTPVASLTGDYHWTWYDEASPGMANWVLIDNPGFDHNGNAQGTVTATIRIAGMNVFTESIAPGQTVTPDFPGTIGGPVEVDSSGGDVMVSQRVLYNGFFNEVLGQEVSVTFLPTGVGVYGAYGSQSIAETAINDGWPILADAGALGTPTSPYTQEVSSTPDYNVARAIETSGKTVTWMSFWTVSAPVSGDTWYNAGYQAGRQAASTLDSYAPPKPDFVILDPEGYGGPPTNTTDWSNFLQGWAAGMHSIDSVLQAGFYGNQYQFSTYGLTSINMPGFVAVSPILNNTPFVSGGNVKGYIAYYASCPAAPYVQTINGWGQQFNTLQFSDSGVDCGP